MARARSFLESMTIDQAGSSHDCRHDAKHRISKGEFRLKVQVGRSYQHYCLQCAERFLMKDLKVIDGLLKDINAKQSPT